jgi:hypothetical protein
MTATSETDTTNRRTATKAICLQAKWQNKNAGRDEMLAKLYDVSTKIKSGVLHPELKLLGLWQFFRHLIPGPKLWVMGVMLPDADIL